VAFVILRDISCRVWCSVVLQGILKSLHRQDTKTAKNSLPLRLFSVSSVFSVTPW